MSERDGVSDGLLPHLDEAGRRRLEDPQLWAACVGGAVREDELAELAAAAGLDPVGITDRFDSFGGI